MYVVAVDYEDRKRAYEPPVNMEHVGQLRIAVKILHEDYVYNDTRGSNVLITNSLGLRLIDLIGVGR